MERQPMIHLPWEPRPKSVGFAVVTHNWQCVLKIYPDGARNPIMIYGEIKQIAARLRELANQIEGRPVSEWTASEVDEGPPAPPRQASEITQDDMNGDPYHDYPLIARRFPWLADVLPAQYLKAQPRPVDQLSADVAKLLPIVGSLRRGDKWNQSAIAEALGLPGTGGSYYRRIKAIITELEERAA